MSRRNQENRAQSTLRALRHKEKGSSCLTVLHYQRKQEGNNPYQSQITETQKIL